MNDNPSDTISHRSIWVQAKGRVNGHKFKVNKSTPNLYIADHPEGGVVILPIEDYNQCDPPITTIDVTNKLRIVGTHIYCNLSDWDADERIATLHCDGKYRVSLNPFKVEKIV